MITAIMFGGFGESIIRCYQTTGLIEGRILVETVDAANRQLSPCLNRGTGKDSE